MRNLKRAILILTLACVSACQSPMALFATATPTATITPTPTQTLVPTATSTQTPTPAPKKRVIIISIDGLRPDAIELAPMPNLMALMEISAYSLTAQTIFPSATLPSHASMLTGLCPKTHGVDWNDYLPQRGIAQGIDLFDIAQEAGLQTIMVAGKDKLQQVTAASSLDIFVWVNDRDKVVMETLLGNFPMDFDLLFIHLATTDDMGHVHGWLSPEQLSVVYRADEALGALLTALDERGLRDETLLIITADHGGHEKKHGSSLPVDMTIPWIASGPGVEPKQLQTPVHTMDTAATAAYALGLTLPAEWDGAPILEAFGLPMGKPSQACQ
jgi:arylsulfatase A-like enzyme